MPSAPFHTLSLEAAQAVEMPLPADVMPATSVMPQQHTVTGAQGGFDVGNTTFRSRLAYSVDRFPFDDNARPNQSNSVTTIFVDGPRAALNWSSSGMATD